MNKLVYVVDDEPLVLDTVVFVLSSLEPDWHVRGFRNPLEALAAVQAQAPDLVLSDQRMPEMQGSTLLEKVRTLAPMAVRIIVSGYIDLVNLSEVTSAHLYLCKPFDVPKLKETLERTFTAQEQLRDRGLLEVVTGLHSLPSLPHVYHTLLRELEDPRNSLGVIAQTITEDAGISAKVLHLANSPLFGQGQLVSNPIDAVLCLGTEMVKAIILSQKLAQYYAHLSSTPSPVDPARLWQHCWEVAQLSKHIGQAKALSQSQADEAFLAGLLHELGTFILLDNYPPQFERACRAARDQNVPLAAGLAQVFGTKPGSVGAYLLQLWGLPAAVIAAVASQDAPEAQPGNGFSVTTALYVAKGILLRHAPPDSFALADWKQDYLQASGCAADLSTWERIDFKSSQS